MAMHFAELKKRNCYEFAIASSRNPERTSTPRLDHAFYHSPCVPVYGVIAFEFSQRLGFRGAYQESQARADLLCGMLWVADFGCVMDRSAAARDGCGHDWSYQRLASRTLSVALAITFC